MNSEIPTADEGIWLPPGSPYQITYSQALFHEIDFMVNEGFRQIPHGGIEVGGLLYGRIEDDRISIRAFRQIECEHASGPSFNLSERDVNKLTEQIATPLDSPEERSLSVVGWFISHTRGPLTTTPAELSLFDRLFPGPGRITLLVKPQRFQPTRFVFLVRTSDGSIPVDEAENAMILPLPGRSERPPNGAAPSVSSPKPAEPAEEVVGLAPPGETIPPPAPQIPDVEPESATDRPSFSESSTAPRAPVVHEIPTIDVSVAQKPHLQTPVGSDKTRELPVRQPRPSAEKPAAFAPGSGAQFAVVLLIAALLGCCVGYWAYLQLPSPVIPLSVQPTAKGLIVSWPADETRDVRYAALRINDGDPVMISPSQRSLGQASLTAPADEMKIELIAQHWLRDSRGIVRFVRGKPEDSNNESLPGQTAPPTDQQH
jgi:hypothetical protein